jgi:hypothetical protein
MYHAYCKISSLNLLVQVLIFQNSFSQIVYIRRYAKLELFLVTEYG